MTRSLAAAGKHKQKTVAHAPSKVSRHHAKKIKNQCTFVLAFKRRFGNASFWEALHKNGKPVDWAWLENFFVNHLAAVSLYAAFGLDYFHADIDDADTLTIRARFLGEEQDPETEVPARLIHRELHNKLIELGAATTRKPALPLRVEWDMREVDLGYGRELHTVYEVRATFRLSDCRGV